jgi:glycosyltransferase 2 family protein
MHSNRQAMGAAFPLEFLPATTSTWRRKLMVAVRALVVVVIFIFILHSANVATIVTRLNAATALVFAAGVVLLLGQAGLCTARWRLLLESARSRPNFSDSYRAFLEGAFFNEALPSTVGGDAWRVLRWRAAGVSLRAAAASVFMDRLSGAMGVAILAILASLLLSRHGVEAYWTLSVFLLSTLIVCGGVTFIVVVRIWGVPFRHLTRFNDAIANLQKSLVIDRRYFASLIYSVAGHCVSGIAIYLTARSLGVGLSLVLIVSVTACMLLIVMIPVSLAGWGVREASLIALLAPLGVDSEDALLIGVLFGLMSLVSALPGGLSFLVGRKAVYRNAPEGA